MREEYKIIASTYYINKNRKLNSISDINYTLVIDMIQMLYMMCAVFRKCDFEYYIDNNQIKIRPLANKEEEYHNLIFTDNEQGNRAKLLNISDEEYNELDYMNINNYIKKLRDSKKYLYFMSILTSTINGTNLLGERNNIIYYCLFSIRNGKEFHFYLVEVIIKFLLEYRDLGADNAKKILEIFNENYRLMKNIYDTGKVFLLGMKSREENNISRYENNFFINESITFHCWYSDCLTNISKDNILDFIFYKNVRLKKCVIQLMNHIVQISSCLYEGKINIQWENEYRIGISPLEFTKLNNHVNDLKSKCKNVSFDIKEWINKYIDEISIYFKQK